MSPDELRSLFNQWKSDGRRVVMSLWQAGQTKLVWAELSDWVVGETDVKFSFGLPKLASGEISVPLSEFLSIEVLDPKVPRPLDPIDPAFEFCIEFSWKRLLNTDRERCVVCVFKGH